MTATISDENSLDGISSRLDIVEKKTGEFEDTAIENYPK